MLLQRLIVTNTRSRKVTSLLEERSRIFKSCVRLQALYINQV